MKKRKLLIAAIVLLLILLIGGAVAYFTDTAEATNTFTIGNVDITLTEPNWVTTDANSNNVPDAAENKLPGEEIAKDPTVTNVGENDAYIFAKVVSACTTDASPKEIFTYTVNTGWYLMTPDNACTNGSITRIYAYGTNSAMTKVAKNGTAVLFTKVTVNESLTGEETGLTGANKTVEVKAYGVQADGIKKDGNLATAPADVWSAANFS